MNRRSLLAALPAAAVAGAAPAVAKTETPIAAMYREIIRLRDYSYNPASAGRGGETANDQMYELANRIVRIPASSPEDWMLKIMSYTIDGEQGLDECPALEQIWAEARALVA